MIIPHMDNPLSCDTQAKLVNDSSSRIINVTNQSISASFLFVTHKFIFEINYSFHLIF